MLEVFTPIIFMFFLALIMVLFSLFITMIKDGFNVIKVKRHNERMEQYELEKQFLTDELETRYKAIKKQEQKLNRNKHLNDLAIKIEWTDLVNDLERQGRITPEQAQDLYNQYPSVASHIMNR